MKIKHMACWGTGKDGSSLPKETQKGRGTGPGVRGGGGGGEGGGGVLVLRPPSTIPRSN